MPFREVHSVAELYHLAKKVRPVAHALQNAWHLLSPGHLTPFVVHLRHFASGVSVLNQPDLGFVVGHSTALYHAGCASDLHPTDEISLKRNPRRPEHQLLIGLGNIEPNEMSVFGLNLRRIWVKKKRFGDEQIIGVSKRAQARAPVAEVIGRRGSA